MTAKAPSVSARCYDPRWIDDSGRTWPFQETSWDEGEDGRVFARHQLALSEYSVGFGDPLRLLIQCEDEGSSPDQYQEIIEDITMAQNRTRSKKDSERAATAIAEERQGADDKALFDTEMTTNDKLPDDPTTDPEGAERRAAAAADQEEQHDALPPWISAYFGWHADDRGNWSLVVRPNIYKQFAHVAHEQFEIARTLCETEEWAEMYQLAREQATLAVTDLRTFLEDLPDDMWEARGLKRTIGNMITNMICNTTQTVLDAQRMEEDDVKFPAFMRDRVLNIEEYLVNTFALFEAYCGLPEDQWNRNSFDWPSVTKYYLDLKARQHSRKFTGPANRKAKRDVGAVMDRRRELLAKRYERQAA